MTQLLDAALFYASINWPVFPCKPGTKVPDGTIVPHGVKHATTDAAVIQKWWGIDPNYNIGFACGEPHGVYVVDVDVDLEKGVNGLESLKEFQVVYGVVQNTPRGGKHLFYHSVNKVANSPKFRHGMEIRGTGYYVMLAPSVHPNDKIYEWEKGKNPWDYLLPEMPPCLQPSEKSAPAPSIAAAPVEISNSDLADRIRRWIALVDPAVQGQNGHAKLLWACGCLTHGWELTSDEAYAVLVTEYNPRCEPPWDLSNGKDQRDFSRKITESIKNPPRKPRGWLKNDPTYSPLAVLPENVVASVEDFLRRFPPKAAVASPAISKKIDPLRTKPLKSELDFLCSPLGKLGELCSWINASSRRVQPFLTLGCSLSFLGALFGRKVEDESEGRTNIYGMGIGDSSVGKGHAQKYIKKICARTQSLEIIGGSDFTGDSAIEKQLELHESTVYLLDEIGHILMNIKGHANQHTSKIVPTLMKLWSSADETYIGKHFADREQIRSIVQPCCCIWGTSVPERFIAGLSPEELYDGWLSRCLVYRTETKPRKIKKYRKHSLSDAICDWVAAWFARDFKDPNAPEAIAQWVKTKEGGVVAQADPILMVVPTTDEAEGIFSWLDDFSHNVGDQNHELSRLWDKAEEYSRRIALILAASIDYDNPVIDGACADFACRLMYYLLCDFGYATVDLIVGSVIEEKKNKILLFVARSGSVGRSKKELAKATGWARISERDELMRDLNESGMLVSRIHEKEIRHWITEYYPGG